MVACRCTLSRTFLVFGGNTQTFVEKYSVCLHTQTNFFLTPARTASLYEQPAYARTHERTLLTFGLSAIVWRISGHMHARSHISATHGNQGLSCQQHSELSPAHRPALSPLSPRAKLHHGYTPAMVTLPKRCCGSVLSPW